MSDTTKIEWADATVNFWAGCSKVSPACDNCYAEKMAGRLWGVKWGAGEARKQFLGAADTVVKLDRKAKRLGLKPLVFINSMSDLFDNEVEDADRADAFEAMSMCTELTFLLLTKRIGNVGRYLQRDPVAAQMLASGRAYLGITVVNQEEADRDIPKLLAVPARVRFLSMEPLLGPVDLTCIPVGGGHGHHEFDPVITGNVLHRAVSSDPSVHWVIAGGESGPNARPMHPDWARGLRDQCAAAGVPFLFKQWGQHTAHEVDPEGWSSHLSCIDFEGRDCALSRGEQRKAKGEPWWFLPPWPGRGTWGPDGIPPGVLEVRSVGKKAAGRLLDGVEHNGFPEVSP